MASEKITNEGEVIRPYKPVPRSPRSTYTPLGSKWKINAKLSVDPVTGEKIAEPGEKIDLNAYVQASRASTDIVAIVKKLEAGDESVINVRQGFYGDCSMLPKDINDVVAIEKMNASAREKFNNLPEEVKKLFNDDPAKFFSAVLDGSAESLINSYIVAAEKAAKEAAAAAAQVNDEKGQKGE